MKKACETRSYTRGYQSDKLISWSETNDIKTNGIFLVILSKNLLSLDNLKMSENRWISSNKTWNSSEF